MASIVVGMVAGADSVDDPDVLREGRMGEVLPEPHAPSTLGTFLRAFTSDTSASSARSPPAWVTGSRAWSGCCAARGRFRTR